MGNWEIGEFVRKWEWQLKMGLFETWSGHHDLVNARGQLELGQIGYLEQRLLIWYTLYIGS